MREERADGRQEVLRAEHVSRRFRRAGSLWERGEAFDAVRDVSFSLCQGELLGLLGESGCGKTTLARMLMHLIRPSEGRILLDGVEIQGMRESAFRKKRRTIQMVYQNPFDCLDPVRRICGQLTEPMKLWYPDLSSAERKDRICRMLRSCGLPENSLQKLPGEFSGGQLQRISIARALLARPRVLIADEIISALDVPVQNQILQLLLQMKREYHLTILFITHDLCVAEKVADRVMVMQAGQIKGIGTPKEVFSGSTDPYLRALKDAVFFIS